MSSGDRSSSSRCARDRDASDEDERASDDERDDDDARSIHARSIDDDDDARTGRGLTGTTRAGTREKVSRSWNRGAAREHRGGEERGEDVEVISGTKGAR